MEKGDWQVIIIVIMVLIIIAFLTMSMDKLFPTPTVQQAIKQVVVNAT
jgi:Tfp pilus assembly protein PilX